MPFNYNCYNHIIPLLSISVLRNRTLEQQTTVQKSKATRVNWKIIWGILRTKRMILIPSLTKFWFLCPNFEEVWVAYCFWGIRPSIRSSRFLMHSITLEPCMLLFWNFFYGFLIKIADIFFLDRIVLLSWVMAVWKNMDAILSQKLLKLEPWTLVNRLIVMRRWPDELLKKIKKNTSWVMAICKFGYFYLVSKISQKLFVLEPWNLTNGFVVMSRWPD